MTIATLKTEIKDLKNALNTPLDEKLKAKLREQLSKSEKTLAEMESAKTPTAKKNATKKANVVAKKSTSVLQKIKKANKKVEPKKATPKKATTTKKPSVLQQLKSKIKLTKNLSGYKKSGIDLVRDADRPALPMGKRISKDGNVYYENRLNRVDIKQPPKRYPKLEDGGEIGNWYKEGTNIWGLGNTEIYIKKHNNIFELTDAVYDENKSTWIEKTIHNFDSFEEAQKAGYARKLNIYDEGGMINKNKIYLISDDGYEVNISESDFMKETKMFFKKSMTQQEVKKLGTSKYNQFIHYLSKNGYEKMAKGGMMAKGGQGYSDVLMSKKRFYEGQSIIYDRITSPSLMKALPNWNKYADKELVIEEIEFDTPYKRAKVFVRSTGEKVPFSVFLNDSVHQYANGGMMAKGGRLKSAIMRDRAYKSNEPHEQAYTRKTRPKNPKYNYGFFADGGEVIMTDVYAKKDGKVVKVNERPMELKEAERFVKEQGIEKYYTDVDFKFINKDFGYAQGGMSEMHRAYAMGGVLQHGLEMGDFIISHDEGKMVVMNGGSKYEVNIHSGSRTKID